MLDGAHLELAYDVATNAFVGTVKNKTNQTLSRVRVEVHLSNGTELGPTAPIDLAPGQETNIELSIAGQDFNKWSAHAVDMIERLCSEMMEIYTTKRGKQEIWMQPFNRFWSGH